MIDPFGVEPVLVSGLTLGACCVLASGCSIRDFGESHCLLWGVGIASGCQAGIISLSALTYPSAIRSPGAGWVMGAGRVGTIAGPLCRPSVGVQSSSTTDSASPLSRIWYCAVPADPPSIRAQGQ